MKISDLHLIANEIIPPLPGELKYAEKVQGLSVTQGGDRKKIMHNVGEARRSTEIEPKAKMTALVEEWVMSQP